MIKEFVGNCTHLSAEFIEELMDNSIELEEESDLYKEYAKSLVEWGISKEDIDDNYSYLYISKIRNKKYVIFQFSAIEYVWEV